MKMRIQNRSIFLILLSLFFLIIQGCANNKQPDSGKLQVVATTSIIGDVVEKITSDKIELTVLLPRGSSPHSFDPTPRDMSKLNNADIIFINGLGLESGIDKILAQQKNEQKTVSVSSTITPVKIHETAEEEGHMSDEEHVHHHHHEYDPHVWMSPTCVKGWVGVISTTLSKEDPANASFYNSQSESYIASLENLDLWIKEQLKDIPAEDRNIIPDHLVFGYFAKEYNFNQIASIIPGFSSLAQPSALDIARLEDTIKNSNIHSILVGQSFNPALAEQIGRDTGIKVINYYSGSLGKVGNDASDYISFMKYNVRAILEGCK